MPLQQQSLDPGLNPCVGCLRHTAALCTSAGITGGGGQGCWCQIGKELFSLPSTTSLSPCSTQSWGPATSVSVTPRGLAHRSGAFLRMLYNLQRGDTALGVLALLLGPQHLGTMTHPQGPDAHTCILRGTPARTLGTMAYTSWRQRHIPREPPTVPGMLTHPLGTLARPWEPNHRPWVQ